MSPLETGEAAVEYRPGSYRLLKPGQFVRCAVSAEPIPLDQLRYWSVERQEAYASPVAVLARTSEAGPAPSGGA
ncbi:DUF2093 domain-containing protein [Enterovirga rhinocerotis]|uniref:DUF2093 domain-containing protein n=1 Tax=Enterovirga rhinocerotis TaxID=1339210 RepID=A0A4R7C9H6_9HYPH|nr:DUF2093 domain-containing protein [Enterovirga rhinocerotis]TDR95315.1 hypothetical protein EV668_0106 [Enterovirga rhinocerotis]